MTIFAIVNALFWGGLVTLMLFRLMKGQSDIENRLAEFEQDKS